MLHNNTFARKTKMLHNNTFARKTKTGRIKKEVREHYLRDDIYCGSHACKSCDAKSARLSEAAATVLIVDTNVVLNQIDLLKNLAIDDVVVLPIVFEEVKNKNLAVYKRLNAICTNPMRNFYVFANEHFPYANEIFFLSHSIFWGKKGCN